MKPTKMPTFKEIFKREPRGSPDRRSPDKNRSPERKMDVQSLLALSQSLISRMRMLQPSDPEAFPVLNECTRSGTSTTNHSSYSVAFAGLWVYIGAH